MIVLFIAETGFHEYNWRHNSNRDISNCFYDYIMWYNRLNVGYDYPFSQIYETAVRYFYIIYDNVRLFRNDLFNNILAGKIYAKPRPKQKR